MEIKTRTTTKGDKLSLKGIKLPDDVIEAVKVERKDLNHRIKDKTPVEQTERYCLNKAVSLVKGAKARSISYELESVGLEVEYNGEVAFNGFVKCDDAGITSAFNQLYRLLLDKLTPKANTDEEVSITFTFSVSRAASTEETQVQEN